MNRQLTLRTVPVARPEGRRDTVEGVSRVSVDVCTCDTVDVTLRVTPSRTS